MMSHARIEEVSDSDSDPSEGNLSDYVDDFDERFPIQQKAAPAAPTPALAAAERNGANSLIDPNQIPTSSSRAPPKPFVGADGTAFQPTEDDSKYKDFQCLYPIYFDKTRSRAEGRRVGLEMAVENPLARDIVAACGRLRLETLFEPSKAHPKDWANPGRVKVRVKGVNNPNVKSKHHLYLFIAEYLKANPTTTATASLIRVPGAPPPDPSKPYPEPAVPRGVKMGRILPYYSPAVTGGGVSDNFLGDMMKEMGGQMPPGMEGMANMLGGAGGSAAAEPAAGPKKEKKIKRKIIRG